MWFQGHAPEPLLSRGRKLVPRNGVLHSGEGIPAWPQRYRHILGFPGDQAALGTVRLRTSVNSDPLEIQTRTSETKLPCSSSAMGMGAGFSRHPFRELCYGIFRYGGPWSPINGRPLSLRGKPCCMVQITRCNVGKPPRHLEAFSLFVGPPGHKLHREQSSPTRPCSGAGDLETAAPHWNFHAPGPELNPSLGSEISVLDGKPYVLGNRETQCRLLLAQQKEEAPMGLPRNRTGGSSRRSLQGTPISWSTP